MSKQQKMSSLLDVKKDVANKVPDKNPSYGTKIIYGLNKPIYYNVAQKIYFPTSYIDYQHKNTMVYGLL